MRLVVGISGASGVIYGIRLLEACRQAGVETHLIMTRPGSLTVTLETDMAVSQVTELATHVYRVYDVAAAISSGSFHTDGMVVCPCSIHTAAAIAHSLADNLLVRAADVSLKERRKLVLVVRETPLHLGHMRVLTALAEMGAVVMPPMPAFYTRPQTIEDILTQTVARILGQFGLEVPGMKSWQGPDPTEE